MAECKVKRTFICLSSSSEEVEDSNNEEEDDEEEVEESGNEEEEADADGDDNDDDEEEEEEVDEEEENDDDDESLCNKCIRLLKEGSDLESLTLKECKAYLRKHGLRLAGIKAVCIQRIKEHWSVKDGNGDAFYPRSTFFINCTGDVCKGDVVLFTQKVYEKFNKVTRHGTPLGKRTIAGRVVKESYGAAKQQHTFTVEVLWSKGMNRLPPLFPLLVKGRNLYKLRTFRQRWSDESERIKVLAEKHKRGTAARLARVTKKMKKTCSTDAGFKRQKTFHLTRPSQSRKTSAPERGKHFDRHGKTTFQGHEKLKNHCQHREVPPVRQVNIKGNAISGASNPSRRHQKSAHPNDHRVPTFDSYVDPPQNLYQPQRKFQNSSLHQFSSYSMGSTSTMVRLPSFRDFSNTSVMPAAQHQVFNHSNYAYSAYSNRTYNFELRNFNHIPGSMNVERLLHRFPLGTETYGQHKYRF